MTDEELKTASLALAQKFLNEIDEAAKKIPLQNQPDFMFAVVATVFKTGILTITSSAHKPGCSGGDEMIKAISVASCKDILNTWRNDKTFHATIHAAVETSRIINKIRGIDEPYRPEETWQLPEGEEYEC